MIAPPRRLPPADRHARMRQALILSGLLAVAACLDPDRPLPIDLCAFRSLTGWPCPGCGLTRALCHALRGHWSTSLHYHPAGLLLAATLCGWAIWQAAEAATGRPVATPMHAWLGRSIVGAGVAVSLVFWIVELTSAS